MGCRVCRIGIDFDSNGLEVCLVGYDLANTRNKRGHFVKIDREYKVNYILRANFQLLNPLKCSAFPSNLLFVYLIKWWFLSFKYKKKL